MSKKPPANLPSFAAVRSQTAQAYAAAATKTTALAKDGAAWAKANPGKAAAYGTVGTVGVVAVAAPGAIAGPVLSLAGFGAKGVTGGKHLTTITCFSEAEC